MSTGTPPVRRGARTLPPEAERLARTEPNTAIVQLPEAPPSSARLCFTAGPRAGEELQLPELDEVVVGRAVDNPVAIPDSSVSRKHALLRRVGGGWAVSDLGSGNGTLVNGEPVEEERPLASGDTLTLGDSELRFEDGGQATTLMTLPARLPVPAPVTVHAVPMADAGGGPARPGPRVRSARASRAAAASAPEAQALRKKRLMIAGGAFAVLMLLLIGLKAKLDADARHAQESARVAAAQRARLGALFQESKNLVREGKWAEAKARLDTLAAARPDYPGVQDYLERAAKEVPNQAHLEEARGALAKSALGPAAMALAQVTPDTTQYDAVRALRAQLLTLSGQRVLEAKRLLDARELDAAKAVTADVLVAFPDQRDAKLLDEQAAQAIRLRDAPPPSAQGAAPRPWEPAVARFIDGDLTGAAALANACVGRAPRCKALLGQMSEFGGLYRKLEDLDAKGLARLLALDREITDGRASKMARTAGTRAASIFYKSASAAKASGQWGKAGEYARRTLQADPGHAGASNLLTELRTRAKDLYLSAYSLKDTSPDEALPRFREVMQMTAPGDETYEKAKGWVDKLSR
ncbi:FHA domain-containing protein [Aggregicoccus sp. 17bor-14]|uniref:FHA domain-containing protein n=1 Tax=Myxococcaceae TaxID=31 RepID=UPI00129CA306|nr:MULTISPECIES: FHA domain-containing protein [Myxococcaceae]MBF5045560.1 FHA domain-containing protein [Simulacricoccus sp. 17bor-14]MRI91297.1 FHA domain-containing protein [Aggregicoccus sp. 17bor-14]